MGLSGFICEGSVLWSRSAWVIFAAGSMILCSSQWWIEVFLFEELFVSCYGTSSLSALHFLYCWQNSIHNFSWPSRGQLIYWILAGWSGNLLATLTTLGLPDHAKTFLVLQPIKQLTRGRWFRYAMVKQSPARANIILSSLTSLKAAQSKSGDNTSIHTYTSPICWFSLSAWACGVY